MLQLFGVLYGASTAQDGTLYAIDVISDGPIGNLTSQPSKLHRRSRIVWLGRSNKAIKTMIRVHSTLLTANLFNLESGRPAWRLSNQSYSKLGRAVQVTAVAINGVMVLALAVEIDRRDYESVGDLLSDIEFRAGKPRRGR